MPKFMIKIVETYTHYDTIEADSLEHLNDMWDCGEIPSNEWGGEDDTNEVEIIVLDEV